LLHLLLCIKLQKKYMGAWNVENFDNDTAMDWIYDFSLTPSADMLFAAFEAINNNTGYIDSDDGATALAAAEVIAAVKGHITNAWPEDIEVPASLHISSTLLAAALQAINKVSSDESELKALWQESDAFANWVAVVQNLQQRLLTQ
jgi:hypothetical protein